MDSAAHPGSRSPNASSPDLPSPGPLRRWILEHDDSWLFTILYVGLALVLSIWISLFWLVAVVGVHFLLECVRQRSLARPGGNVPLLAVWEIKLDLSLILFALALTAYMEWILGVAGLGGAARVGVKGAARVGGWGRAIKATLLSLDDAAQIARLAFTRKSARTANDSTQIATPADETPADEVSDREVHDREAVGGSVGRDTIGLVDPCDVATWSRGDRWVIGFGAVCLASLLIAPWLTEHTPSGLLLALISELHPYPGS